jgi:hypothetical protein
MAGTPKVMTRSGDQPRVTQKSLGTQKSTPNLTYRQNSNTTSMTRSGREKSRREG